MYESERDRWLRQTRTKLVAEIAGLQDRIKTVHDRKESACAEVNSLRRDFENLGRAAECLEKDLKKERDRVNELRIERAMDGHYQQGMIDAMKLSRGDDVELRLPEATELFEHRHENTDGRFISTTLGERDRRRGYG